MSDAPVAMQIESSANVLGKCHTPVDVHGQTEHGDDDAMDFGTKVLNEAETDTQWV